MPALATSPLHGCFCWWRGKILQLTPWYHRILAKKRRKKKEPKNHPTLLKIFYQNTEGLSLLVHVCAALRSNGLTCQQVRVHSVSLGLLESKPHSPYPTPRQPPKFPSNLLLNHIFSVWLVISKTKKQRVCGGLLGVCLFRFEYMVLARMSVSWLKHRSVWCCSKKT